MKISSLLNSLVLAGVLATPAAFAGGLISNGTVRMGVTDFGSLVVSDPGATDYGATGIRYLPTDGEALAPGCHCEAWGVGDAITSRQGNAGEDTGNQNIVSESFTSTATTATSITRITDAGVDMFRVTHNFAPSGVPELFRVKVTVQNISAAAVQLRYRRAMDWDVPPTAFDELVTLYTGGSSNIIFSSDDGFASGNPFTGPSSILFTGQAVDSGPADHGALFDFDFGALAAGASKEFTIFYGAAATQTAAFAALSAVGAEAYSLGKPDPAQTGQSNGVPNTFIFGFKGVGGAPIDPDGRVNIPVPVNTPAGYAVMALLLAMLAYQVSRQRKN